jgi:hypothetical protein
MTRTRSEAAVAVGEEAASTADQVWEVVTTRTTTITTRLAREHRTLTEIKTVLIARHLTRQRPLEEVAEEEEGIMVLLHGEVPTAIKEEVPAVDTVSNKHMVNSNRTVNSLHTASNRLTANSLHTVNRKHTVETIKQDSVDLALMFTIRTHQ